MKLRRKPAIIIQAINLQNMVQDTTTN